MNILPPRSLACLTTPLEEAFDLRTAGGKAVRLANMLQMRLPVPPGWVITSAAFELFLREQALRSRIEEERARLDPARPETFQQASRVIRPWILEAPWPGAVHEALLETRSRFEAAGPLIVRSSAAGEDGAQASFAGQLDSVHPVRTAEEFLAAIRACWASFWSARSLFYQRTRSERLETMAVIVQPLVDSAVAGVLFTQSPERKLEPDSMVLEYVHGHGEGLVSGSINPGRINISRTSSAIHRVHLPEQQARPQLEEVLENALPRLGRSGLQIEEAFGSPQDIEWCLTASGELFIVQARPITAGPGGPCPEARHQSPTPIRSASRRLIRWSNANVNENFPAPVSPLLYSIAATGYYHYFRNLAVAFGFPEHRIRALEYPLRQVIGAHGGRIYYNLTAIHTLLRAAPRGRDLVRLFDLFVGAPSSETAAGSSAHPEDPPLTRWSALENLRVAGNFAWQYLFLTGRVEEFERRVTAFCRMNAPDRLSSACPSQLLAALRGFIEIRCHHWTHPALADAGAMVSYGLLREFLRRAFPESAAAGPHNSLLKGLPGLVSGIPPVELWKLSRAIRQDRALLDLFASKADPDILHQLKSDPAFAGFNAGLERFLRDWGFRISGELMLTVPGFDENPAALISWLRAYAQAESSSPEAMLRQQASERLELTERVAEQLKRRRCFGRLPKAFQAPLFRTLLRWTQNSVALRERARLKQAQLYQCCRRIALAIGDRWVGERRLERREDVFWFTWQELESLLAGGALFPRKLRASVELRRQQHEELSAMQPPDHFSLPEGEYFHPHNDGAGASRKGSDTADRAAFANRLAGRTACGGVSTGPAALLRDLTETGRLRSGDILVTRQTDPGWAPVFCLIKGLVLERGGMLSHGAIIAREFGIPCVVGVAHATERLTHGQHITVNGEEGYVEHTNPA